MFDFYDYLSVWVLCFLFMFKLLHWLVVIVVCGKRDKKKIVVRGVEKQH